MTEPIKKNRRLWIGDRLGILLSAACVLHCLAVPFLLGFVPVLAVIMPGGEWAHVFLAIASLPVTMIALGRGHRQHGSVKAFLYGVPGLFFLLSSLFLEEIVWLEQGVVLLGCCLIITAHFLNYNLLRRWGSV